MVPFRLCAGISAPANLMPKIMKASLRLEKLLKSASGAKKPQNEEKLHEHIHLEKVPRVNWFCDKVWKSQRNIRQSLSKGSPNDVKISSKSIHKNNQFNFYSFIHTFMIQISYKLAPYFIHNNKKWPYKNEWTLF